MLIIVCLVFVLFFIVPGVFISLEARKRNQAVEVKPALKPRTKPRTDGAAVLGRAMIANRN